ncbi:diacylglycerol kinase family protein [Bacillus sp. FJAT-49732]|uniref:Diacylglycerol kinase family protein n=1 Tax=Lederbergia citrisecunda TaxID=2833583 RepID=A0A942TLZ2_9BACI|nr:diacylglycerol kinase family protein [Lederbergia citrisecunda]MBS4199708.1 diacylglycerol kinase family protein [Lederbergia citrisecunda]
MALRDRGGFSIDRIACAFKYAIEGIIHASKVEKNFQVHIICAIIVSALSFILKIDKMEWLFIIISIFGVLSLELINSALERAVDIATKEIKPLAKQAKDLAAAAVLVYAIMSVIIGIVILGPKMIKLFF